MTGGLTRSHETLPSASAGREGFMHSVESSLLSMNAIRSCGCPDIRQGEMLCGGGDSGAPPGINVALMFAVTQGGRSPHRAIELRAHMPSFRFATSTKMLIIDRNKATVCRMKWRVRRDPRRM